MHLPPARASDPIPDVLGGSGLKPLAGSADDGVDPLPLTGSSPSRMFPTRLTALAVACAGMLLAAPTALAASSPTGENTPPAVPPAGPTRSAWSRGGLVRTFVVLAIVLAVICGRYGVLKQVKAS